MNRRPAAPEVFLFDEPLSNLDAELRVSMRIEIAKLHRQLRNTMVYVTHDQTEAMTLADKIVVLRDGRIEQVGTPRDLYENPENKFVAGFIGSPRMNFFDAYLDETGNLYVSGNKVGSGMEHGQSGNIVLGLRPEHLVLDNLAPNGLPAKVDFSEYLGGTRFIYATLDDGQTLVAEYRDGPEIKTGDTLHFSYPPDRLRLFHKNGNKLG